MTSFLFEDNITYRRTKRCNFYYHFVIKHVYIYEFIQQIVWNGSHQIVWNGIGISEKNSPYSVLPKSLDTLLSSIWKNGLIVFLENPAGYCNNDISSVFMFASKVKLSAWPVLLFVLRTLLLTHDIWRLLAEWGGGGLSKLSLIKDIVC